LLFIKTVSLTLIETADAVEKDHWNNNNDKKEELRQLNVHNDDAKDLQSLSDDDYYYDSSVIPIVRRRRGIGGVGVGTLNGLARKPVEPLKTGVRKVKKPANIY
ncbi:unnamed protein product, partial [Didymodactylos carnosus]